MALAATLAAPAAPAAPGRPPADAIRAAEAAAGAALRVRLAPDGRTVRFLSVGAGIPLAAPRAAAPDVRVRSFLDAHGALFGLGAGEARVIAGGGLDEAGMEFARLRQESRGVPVTGAGVTVQMRGGRVVSALARTVPDAGAVDVRPSLAAADAHARAAALMTGLDAAGAALAAPRLEIFNRGLLDGGDAPTRLAWFVEARARARHEWIWIDADSGEVLLHFNHLPEALNRQIYDAMNTAAIPGTLARSEGGAATGNLAVDRAYDFSADTYGYFLSQHGRDSFDAAGGQMISTVNSTFCGSPCFNAFWIGDQTVYGLNFVVDDIVGHEWTHGVTQYEANLIYFMESGALNESFSDIFGETIDLENGIGSDAPENRWWIGEDILPGMLAGIRYMSDPTIANDPAKMSDPQFVCNDGSVDSGGVHSNSAIGNHAYALMVDGGTYNGFTIAGIGLTKAAKIEYRALTQYLLPSSTYADKYDAMVQSCADLLGVAGISAADCAEMQKALDAVEMSSPWPCVSGTPTPTPTATPTPTPAPACGATPRGGCSAAAKGLVLLKRDGDNPGKNKLVWKWIKGTAGSVFANPVSGATYSLCLYDAAGSLLISEVPPGTGWESKGNGAFKYDGDLSAGGIALIKLKPGNGNAKILVKGKGANLALPALTFSQPLTVQLVKDTGPLCWESSFAVPALKSGETVFKDKIP
jgi:Zn-dependent metalloprotease